ncbi:MAG TPA: hypothetical protein VMX18_04855 [Candidatus Bipolaricaulota bacterium]|nr:hypothetical protein [Candidatus Bipolaricaulota bacterium]
MTPNNIDEEIHVMPKSSGIHTVSPSSPAAMPPRATAPVSSMDKPTLEEPKGSKGWTKAVLAILLVALLAASGYFLYSAYMPKEENTATNTQNEQATEQPTAVFPATSEIIEPATTPATKESVISPATSEALPEIMIGSRNDFDYGATGDLKLDMAYSQDSDGDKLTDQEEKLFGTGVQNIDSDSDGYSDGDEVANLYSPKDADGKLLKDTNSVKTYVNDNYDYTVLYPASWFAKGTDKSDLEVVFSSDNGEFVSVWVEENIGRLSLSDWYKKQAPEANLDDLTEFGNKNGLSGLMSPDGFTAYFVKDGFVYIVHYNIGLKDRADYPNVFKLMIESFNFIVSERG